MRRLFADVPKLLLLGPWAWMVAFYLVPTYWKLSFLGSLDRLRESELVIFWHLERLRCYRKP